MDTVEDSTTPTEEVGITPTTATAMSNLELYGSAMSSHGCQRTISLPSLKDSRLSRA